jgi:hypothetical protein
MFKKNKCKSLEDNCLFASVPLVELYISKHLREYYQIIGIIVAGNCRDVVMT